MMCVCVCVCARACDLIAELVYGSGCSCGCGGCACGEFKLYIDEGATESKFGSSQKTGLVSYTIFTQEQPQFHNFSFSWPFNREVAIKSIRLYPGTRSRSGTQDAMGFCV